MAFLAGSKGQNITLVAEQFMTRQLQWSRERQFYNLVLSELAVEEVLSDESTGHVQLYQQKNYPDSIDQIALGANKCTIIFYLKGTRRQWLRVSYSENEYIWNLSTVCKQLINIK